MIKQCDDIFPSELFEQCCRYSLSLLKNRSKVFFTNFAWPENVVHDSTPVLIHALTPNDHLFPIVQQHIQTIENLTAKQIHFTYWPLYSYIPWHEDGNSALTVYLNTDWNHNNGGIFLYNLGDGIRGITPKANMGILQGNGLLHGTTPVTPRGKLRRTLQIWF